MSARHKINPLYDLLDALGSNEFYTDIAIASTPRSMYLRLVKHRLVQELQNVIQINPDNAADLLGFATALVRDARGSVRGEYDVALCASLIALSSSEIVGFDDLLRGLRASRELSLRWASEVADIISKEGLSTARSAFLSGPLSNEAVILTDDYTDTPNLSDEIYKLEPVT